MKKLIKFLIVLIAANIFIFSSCNKKNDPAPTTKTKTQLLTQSPWKFKSATAGGSDASGYLQACQKDNIYTFAAAGTGNMDEGPTSCSPPEGTAFTWNFASNETILHISTTLFSNTSNDFNLISLTETELVVSTVYTPPAGPVILITITFQH